LIISAIKSKDVSDKRSVLHPETIKNLISKGIEIIFESGIGDGIHVGDQTFIDLGAKPVSRESCFSDAEIILTPSPIDDHEVKLIGGGKTLMGMVNPFDNQELLKNLCDLNINLVSMEFVPRITRAQKMDVLSSQANLAGYVAVIESSSLLSSAMPMMMTAAGTVKPARVFVFGVGVAGLQAIATAKRLGARVWAFDIRKEAKDQVESLGAKFVEASAEAQDSVYAQEVSEEENQKIQEALKKQVIDSDMVLTFAQIPGKKAPVLIEKSTIENMRENSVIVDLAAGTGGNCEGTELNKVVEINGVKIVGETDILNTVKHAATKLYSENVRNLIELYIENRDDEIFVEMIS